MTGRNQAACARQAVILGLAVVILAPGLPPRALGQQPLVGTKKSPSDKTSTNKLAAPGQGTAPVPKDAPTYTKDIAAILQAKCQSCHRRHQVGPFALETYEQARKRAHDIAFVTEERSMPPWKPTRGFGPKLKHDQSLTAKEISALAAWAEAGSPLGDPKDLPAPRAFAEGWKLGPPDLILEPPEDYAVVASGADVYRCFVLPTNLAKDCYVEAVDYAPTARSTVHHLIAYIDTLGRGRMLDEDSPGSGYPAQNGPGFEADELSFWTAGLEPHRLPEGVGIRLPAQADIVVQVHYHSDGKARTDRTRVGLYLARKPVKQALHWNNASSYNFKIPAGQNNVEVKASWMIPVAVEAVAVSPHMHLLGHDMHMSVRLPSGRVENLIHIANWDPSWQSAYYFQKPITLPAGSTLNVVAHFDNSAHSRNPNRPPKMVKVGQNFDDEMCVGYIAVVKKDQDLTNPGARDDLFEIFSKQRERLIRQQMGKKKR